MQHVQGSVYHTRTFLGGGCIDLVDVPDTMLQIVQGYLNTKKTFSRLCCNDGCLPVPLMWLPLGPESVACCKDMDLVGLAGLPARVSKAFMASGRRAAAPQ